MTQIGIARRRTANDDSADSRSHKSGSSASGHHHDHDEDDIVLIDDVGRGDAVTDGYRDDEEGLPLTGGGRGGEPTAAHSGVPYATAGDGGFVFDDDDDFDRDVGVMEERSRALPSMASGGGKTPGGGYKEDYEDEDKLAESTETLPEDVYSILMLAPRRATSRHPKSLSEYRSDVGSVFFVLCLWIFQMTIFVIVAMELFSYLRVKDGDPVPPFNQPVNITTETRVAQAFAIVIAVATQDDVIASILLGFNGSLRRKVPVSGCWYALACLLKWSEGMLGLFISWVLVVQSDSAVQLFAEFAGLAFVNELDDVLFRLAHSGFFGSYLQHKTRKVTEFEIPEERNGWVRFLPRLMTALVLASMIIPWGIYTKKQMAGEYYSPRLVVRIGDSISGRDGFHSGQYERIGLSPVSYHPVYVEQIDPQKIYDALGITKMNPEELEALVADDPEVAKTIEDINSWPRGHFGYCITREVWTYYEGNWTDPCTEIIFRTKRTKTFDVTDVTPSDWLVEAVKVDGDKSSSSAASQISVPDFALSELECHEDKDCNAGDGGISGQEGDAKVLGTTTGGVCDLEDGTCRCAPNYVGLKCEFKVCRTIVQDLSLRNNRASSGGGMDMSTSFVPSRFETLYSDDDKRTLLEVYNRPVYAHWDGDDSMPYEERFLTCIIFTGRRWALVDMGVWSMEELRSLLTHFHGMWLTMPEFSDGSGYVSEPTDAASPKGLSWSRLLGVKDKKKGKGDASLLSSSSGGDSPSSGGEGKKRVQTNFILEESSLIFVCADCGEGEEIEDCGPYGTCGETSGVCECNHGYAGHECDKPRLQGRYTLYIPDDHVDSEGVDDGLSCGICASKNGVDLEEYLPRMDVMTGGPEEYDTATISLEVNHTHLNIFHAVGPRYTVLPCSYDEFIIDWDFSCFTNWTYYDAFYNVSDTSQNASATPGSQMEWLAQTGDSNVTVVKTFARNTNRNVRNYASFAVEVHGLDVRTNVDVGKICPMQHQLSEDECGRHFWFVNQTRAILQTVFELNGQEKEEEDASQLPPDRERHREHAGTSRFLLRERL